MKRLNGFKCWLIESIVEATVRFGNKYRDKDVGSVPSGFWTWLIDAMSEKPNWTPQVEDDDGRMLSRTQVLNLARARSASTPQPQRNPVPNTSASNVVSSSSWILAKVVNVPGLNPGDHVVVTRSGDDWTAMTQEGETKKIPGNQIKTALSSVRDAEGKPVSAQNPEELWATLPKKPAAAAPKKGENPHILGTEKLSDEQKKIDERFERMMKSGTQDHMMISALAGTGKAQPLDSLLLTPSGWVRMGDISIGDEVFGSDGLSHKVTGVFPQGIKEVVRVNFTDGVSVECCEDHLWLTETKRDRDKSRIKNMPLFSHSNVRATKELMGSVDFNNHPNHYIPLIQPLQFARKEVFIDPYMMGILLGDGCFRSGHVSYSTEDEEIVESVDSVLPERLMSKYVGCGCDYRICGSGAGVKNPVVSEIKRIGLWNKYSYEKHIPDEYKFNDIETRISILQGLLDTDGDVNEGTSNVEYNTTSKQLADDVRFLIESLGGTASLSYRKTKYTHKGVKKTGRLSYRLNLKIPSDIEPFRLSRKKDAYKPRTKYLPKRAIKSIEKIGEKYCQCISVDSEDSLYVTDNCVLTHNTTVLKHLAWKYGNKNQKWLYLVFNTKNRVEAEEYKDGYRKFPDWVDVYTTNSFLNHMLRDKKNVSKIPQTSLMAKLSNRGKVPEKVREIVDFNPEFQKKMKEYGIVSPDVITPELLTRYGGVEERSHKYYVGALKGILKQINYQFKERVLKLNGILKSFAIDPSKSDLETQVKTVFDKYDVAKTEMGEEKGYFDTTLEEVKERIDKYDDPRFRGVVLKILNHVLGYDFMKKDYKDEVIEASTWLLHATLPRATSQKYTQGYGDSAIDYDLADFRDFSDDMWYSSLYADKLDWSKYDVVLADEVQDFNEGQMIMLKKLHDAGAKIVAVGDKNQSIYRFRGADSGAFNKLSKMLGDLSGDKGGEMNLSSNYRSRPGILKFVNDRTHVNDLVAGKKFDDGDGVVTDRDTKYEDAFDGLRTEYKSGKLKETAFIARTNEPLVHAALKLLGNGVPFVIVGKDVAGDLIKHIDQLIREGKGKSGIGDNSPVTQLRSALVNHHEEEVDRHSDKSTKKNYLSELSDTTMALTSSIDNFLGVNPDDQRQTQPDPSKTVKEFKKWMEARLGGLDVQENEGDIKKFKEKMEKEHPVVLTTAHKSKGLEFSRVFILRVDQFPHKKAKHPDDLEQENNAEYVAYTRAMDELHVLKLDGQPGYKK